MNKPERYISYEEHEKLKAEIKRACGELYSIAGGNIPTLGGNDALEAEVARLKAEVEKLKLTLEKERQISCQNWTYDPHYAYLQLNNAKLKVEIERLKGDDCLIKAGDLLYEWMVEAGRRTWSRPVDAITMDKSMEAWEAAKKEVQSWANQGDIFWRFRRPLTGFVPMFMNTQRECLSITMITLFSRPTSSG